jgi:hypothetical protein
MVGGRAEHCRVLRPHCLQTPLLDPS